MTDIQTFITWLGLFGTIVFAVSGALDAARRQMDILGFMLIGCATGLGGGTLRDLLLGVTPVNWVVQPGNVAACLVAAAVTYFVVPHVASRTRALLWMDAIGLSVFCVTGAQVALAQQVSPLIAICMGVMTATFGGIVRDVLCSRDLVLGSRELYVTAALAGSSSYLVATLLGWPQLVAVVMAFSAAMTLRGGAILYGWRLPSNSRLQ